MHDAERALDGRTDGVEGPPCAEAGDVEGHQEAGGHGVISVMANAFPKETVELTNKCLAADSNANDLQKSYGELIDLLFVDGNPAGVKAMLEQKGMIKNVLRLPLCPVSEATYKKISKVI